jgi:hypothetical protein
MRSPRLIYTLIVDVSVIDFSKSLFTTMSSSYLTRNSIMLIVPPTRFKWSADVIALDLKLSVARL